MARFIIGCSNVSRFWIPTSELHLEYTVRKAINYTAQEKALTGFKNNGSSIIIAVLENILEDAIHQATNQAEAREMGKQAIDRTITMIKSKEEKNYPDSTVAITCPTMRPGLEWYDQNVEGWTEDLISATADGKMKRLAIMGILDNENLIFEADGIHFTKESGANYVQEIITNGKKMPINKPPQQQQQQQQEQPKAMEV
jgi:hypothetical protein